MLTSKFFTTPIILSLTLLLTLPILLLLTPHYLFPPKRLQISLSDELDDLALFRRAILASTPSSQSSSTHSHSLLRLSSPRKQKPKIAFLFLTTSSLPFSPLWESFFKIDNPNTHAKLYNIYVHTTPSTPHTSLPPFFASKTIPSKPTERSSPTLISAARRLISHALLDDPLNHFFAVLSPSCIPLHSLPYTYSTLFASPRTSYIEILANESTLPSRYNARGPNLMLPEIPFNEFRVGSQFFAVNKKHALTIIKDRKLWRKFRLPCVDVDSCYPEEHYFPTLLSMSDPKGCSNYTLTNVDWTDSVDGHPRTYAPDEVSDDLIRRLRRPVNSTHEYLFARKFSPECLKPLMDIADDVIFKD